MFVHHAGNLQKWSVVVYYDLFMCLISVWKTLQEGSVTHLQL